MESIIRNRTTQRIIALLIEDNELHIREIARRILVTPIYVKKQLDILLKLGIVNEKKVGNLRLFTINKDSPIYEEMKNIILKTSSVVSILKKFLIDADLAFIYGSYAKAELSRDSDIDLFVIGMEEDKLLKIISEIEPIIKREINYVAWTRKDLKMKKSSPFVRAIFKNKKIMIKGDENEIKRIVK
ncbi:MAG: nucleotidyltransferase domain-containing protein [Nanoarchaeota archaeon]